MADQTRDLDLVDLKRTLGELNAQLGEITPYKLDVVDPREIAPTPKNAHYMPKRVFDALTANIQRDGNLAGLPLCWKREDGRYELLSGNHRVQAAIAAGIRAILILFTDREMARAERVAVQLSHNSLVGLDNPGLLLDLWREIDRVELKAYAGLDETEIDAMEKVELVKLGEASLQIEELKLMFLPEEIAQIEAILERIGKSEKRRFAVPLATWDRFFDALLGFKEASSILNTATAFLVLCETAERYIAEARTGEAAV